MNRLVDYDRYLEFYGPRDVPDPLVPGRVFEGVRRAKTMGSFRRELLTPLGLRALNESKRFLGREPKFRGASKEGCYFKWEVRSWDEYHALTIYRDWLEIDLGLEVMTTESEREPKLTTYKWLMGDVFVHAAGVGGTWVRQKVLTEVPVKPEPEGGNRYLKFDLR